MGAELASLYAADDRLSVPVLHPAELGPPRGTYLVGCHGDAVIAGGGLRPLGADTCEIKRMFVRPPWRSQGVAGRLLSALEVAAVALGYAYARLDTGPLQPHAQRLYEARGYAPIADYNANPYASFWGEKALPGPDGGRG
jgi:GNAT superfamily N-acetyltransferase